MGVAAALTIDRSARRDVEDGLGRGHRAFESLHQDRQALFRAEAQLLADEPRLKALLGTGNAPGAPVPEVVRALRRALRADLLVITDRSGAVLAADADADATSRDFCATRACWMRWRRARAPGCG